MKTSRPSSRESRYSLPFCGRVAFRLPVVSGRLANASASSRTFASMNFPPLSTLFDIRTAVRFSNTIENPGGDDKMPRRRASDQETGNGGGDLLQPGQIAIAELVARRAGGGGGEINGPDKCAAVRDKRDGQRAQTTLQFLIDERE